MKPWRRTEQTKNGVLTLPKECVEFLMYSLNSYSVAIWAIGPLPVKLLDVFGNEDDSGSMAIYGIKRGSFWNIALVRTDDINARDSGPIGSSVPIRVDVENVINFRVNDAGGVATDGVLTGMWR